TERLQNHAAPCHSFEDLFELAFDFLRNPWKLWNSGQLSLKRTVLRLAFCERVAYCREEGLRTPKMALPFKLLTGLEMGDLEMARPGGFEPPTS
ncbi:MAG: recombinase family protein, partial [Geminicoccaceae bacterium]